MATSLPCRRVNFLASPLREVSSSVTSATQNFASLYVTPGVPLKAFPKSRISPYLAVGGGYADYEQSTTEIVQIRHPGACSRSLPISARASTFGSGVGAH